MSYTENLADFGFREIKMLSAILNAWVDGQGLPRNFYGQGVKPAMNQNSGNVFLVNEDMQVAMMNGDNLEIFHNTPDAGHEGFLSDLLKEHKPDDVSADDRRYLIEAYEAEDLSGEETPEEWLKVFEAEDVA